jgi:vacuolar-type H+-ATPase subunit E/Vma4
MNQAIISTTGEGGARSREVAKYQVIDNMIMLGLDPKPESDEEKEYVQRKLQQLEQAAAQPKQEDPVVMLERMKEQTLQMVQQNKQTEHQIQIAKLQTEAEGKGAKLQSEILTNARKLELEQEKIDNTKSDNDYKNALSTLELELQAQKDLNAELMQNIKAFNE